MRAILTIAGKDLRNLLTSPLFFVISGLCSVLWSYSYIRALLSFAERSRMFMQPGAEAGMNLQREVFLMHISQINLLFVFVVPALTMRLLAEEKRFRTYDLLLTSPISSTQIALGKFLAGLGAVSALTLISFLYPLLTRAVAEFPFAPLLSAYLGVLMVSSAYVAVGLFASSLTESIMLSVVLGLIFNILLWFISQGAGSAESMPLVSGVLEYMSLGQHFLNFIMGAIKLASVVFLTSVIGLFVFLTQRVVESSRWR
ncbi:MAG: ABC transporter permease [Bdellovibrionales bacterium]